MSNYLLDNSSNILTDDSGNRLTFINTYAITTIYGSYTITGMAATLTKSSSGTPIVHFRLKRIN